MIIAVKGVSVTPESQAIRKSGLVIIGSGFAMAVFGLLVSVLVSVIATGILGATIGGGIGFIAMGMVVVSLMMIYVGALTIVTGIDIRDELNKGKTDERKWF